jgi:CIC family chloride channel protein
LLAAIIGLAAGLAGIALKHFVSAIQWVQVAIFGNEPGLIYLIFPLLGLFACSIFIRYFVPGALGRGIAGVLYAIYKKSGLMEAHKMWSHLATSALTVGFGGSAGLEAPIVNTGTAIGSNLGRWFRINQKSRNVLIACGAAAAISALFNSPISGVIFSLEILSLELASVSLIPVLIAAVSANLVAYTFNGAEVIVPANYDSGVAYALRYIPWMIGLGVFCAVIALFFTRITGMLEEQFIKIPGARKKALAGGIALGVLIFFFPTLYGEGFESIRKITAGQADSLIIDSPFGNLEGPWVLLLFVFLSILFKAAATTITISSGGNGGYFAPALFCGALSGFLYARILNLTQITGSYDENIFALVGMGGMLAGVMHAPFTAIFFIAEITQGYDLIVPLMLVTAISYLVNIRYEPHSIFTKQLDRKILDLMQDQDIRILHQLSISDVLEVDLQCVDEDSSLKDLVDAVSKSNRNLFPVTNSENHLKGIVTLDDIRSIMFEPELYDTPIQNIMKPPPAQVQISDSMDLVMKKFEETEAWNLPVLEDKVYLGMLSKSKIFELYRSMLSTQKDD